MSASTAIALLITADFNADVLRETLESFKATSKKPANKYQVAVWVIDELMVIQFEKTLLIQGKLNKHSLEILKKIINLKGLTADPKNEQKLRAIFPTAQNSIICPECRATSLEINEKIQGLEINFLLECGHLIELTGPFNILNNRVLPDINMLIAKAVSRLVKMGYLKGVEIVFPEFILETVDQIKGTGLKNSVVEELNDLRKLTKTNSISINTFPNLPLTYTIKNKEDEDKVILDFAHFTNAVLLTGDNVLKARALMESRPTVFVPPEDFGKIKAIDETRT